MEIDLGGYSKEIRTLRQNKYVVRPIKREGGWVPENHDSAFMNDGTTRDFTVPNKERGKALVDPLFDFVKKNGFDDFETFKDELGLEHVRELNPSNKDCFWRRQEETTVKLDRNGKHLDLMDTQDFLEFLILRANSHIIAMGWKNRFNSGEYKFALCQEAEELSDDVSNLEKEKEAFRIFGEMDSDAVKMTDFLFVYYLSREEAKRPPRDATINWLKKEVGKIIKNDLNGYLDILADPDYNLKLLIQRSVETGALQKHGNRYVLPGETEPIGSLQETIDFLDDPQHQTVRMKLMHHVQDKIEA